MIENAEITKYAQITQEVDEVTIGRIVIPNEFPYPWIPTQSWLDFANLMNPSSDRSKDLRHSLTFSLNWNTASQNKNFSHECAASAYFTHKPEKRDASGLILEDEGIIIEWVMGIKGAPGKKGKKVDSTSPHYYLNRAIDFPDRKAQGMKLSSGHLAKIPETDQYLALMDNLTVNAELTPEDPMGKMVNTLTAHGFIPVTTEGFIKHPAF